MSIEREREQLKQVMENGSGQAFPVEFGATLLVGLTKRDYFAAAALQGILANAQLEAAPLDSNPSKTLKGYSQMAYLFADAMLEARK